MIELRSTGHLELRDAEERILAGVVIPYDQPAKIGAYTERFARGAFAGVDAAKVPLMVSHRHAELPIGRTLALDDRADGLHGEWKLAETRDADEVLALARDQIPLSLSVGFAPDVDRWSSDRRSVTRVRARLGEVSVVGAGAYAGAMVTSVRQSEAPQPDQFACQDPNGDGACDHCGAACSEHRQPQGPPSQSQPPSSPQPRMAAARLLARRQDWRA